MFLGYNKKAIFSGVGIAILTASISAQAEESIISGLYLKGEIGASFSRNTGDMPIIDQNAVNGNGKDNDLGRAAVYGLGIGIRLADNFRVEVVGNYRSGHEINAAETLTGLAQTFVGDVYSRSGFLIVAYDLTDFEILGKKTTPYVNGGVGFSRNSVDDLILKTPGFADQVFDDESKTNFAWQIGAGVAFSLTESFVIDAGYRYVDLGEFETSTQRLAPTVVTFQKMLTGEYRSHEFMVGVRLSF